MCAGGQARKTFANGGGYSATHTSVDFVEDNRGSATFFRQGNFQRGDVVACLSPEGDEVARGLVNYSALEVRKIAKQPTSAIESILGYLDEPELIHRDNMVVLA